MEARANVQAFTAVAIGIIDFNEAGAVVRARHANHGTAPLLTWFARILGRSFDDLAGFFRIQMRESLCA